MKLTRKNRDEDKRRYELRFGGNREKPVEERSAVHVLPASTAEMKMIRKNTPTSGRITDPVKASEDRNEAVVRKVVQSRIVEPFELLFNDEDKPIKSAEMLLQAIDQMSATEGAELINELFEAVTDEHALEEGARKN